MPRTKQVTSKDIVRAATNDPALSNRTVILGEREFVIVDLPYDSYITFLSLLQPVLEVLVSQLRSSGSLNAGDLLKHSIEALPDLAYIVLSQTDPTITMDEIKRLAGTPFKLATVVLAQIEQNKMIDDISDFFVQILPLLKVA